MMECDSCRILNWKIEEMKSASELPWVAVLRFEADALEIHNLKRHISSLESDLGTLMGVPKND